jgi:hypothetical protein
MVRTDIAGFVGYAERGPLPEDFAPGFEVSRVARRLTSWDEFTATFGGYLDQGHLACAVRGFFENGGDTCYVARVAATRATIERQPLAARLPLPSGPATPAGVLAAPGDGFTAKLTLAAGVAADGLVGGLLRVTRPGVQQDVLVQGVQADGDLLLSAPLDGHFAAGDPVTLFPSGAAFVARSRGFWGNRLRLDFTALDGGAFGLTVTVDLGPGLLPTEQETYPRLEPATAGALLAAASNLVDFEGAGPLWFDANGPLGARRAWLTGGRDGLTDVALDDFSGSAADRRGLRLLEEIEEVAILAAPDAVLALAAPPVLPVVAQPPCAPPLPDPVPVLPADPTGTPTPLSAADSSTLQMLMIEQCERLRYRVALIDPPYGMKPDDMAGWAASQGLVNRSARFAALYYPWLDIPDLSGAPARLRRVPPSGHVAGVYAQVDLSAGVQHPPANVALAAVSDVAEPLSAAQSGALNDASVNAIRALPGRGIRVWGARSLAPRVDVDWRFIHVRRLMSAIEDTVQRSSRWATFEGNDAHLRSTLSHAVTVLLEGIWSRGGLKGRTPAEGFFVRCDGANNPQAVIDAGQVICQVGAAVAAPMEFIVFEIRQDVTGGTVLEM